MELFWRKGYSDTSVAELGARTGLHRQAIYGDFGSKRKLFEAVLEHYRTSVTARRLSPLREQAAGLAQLEAFFRQFRHAGAATGGRLGCLMCLTAAEVSPHVPSVARIVSAYLGELRRLFRRVLGNARNRGEITAGIDLSQAADYLTGSVLGLMALVRSPAPRAVIAHYVDGVLSSLHHLQPERARAART